MTTEDLLKITKNIEGWLSTKEQVLLYNLAKKCTGKGKIVEIGSWKGKSTICLAKAISNNQNLTIYAIDPHVGSSEHQQAGNKVWTFDQFKANISNAGVADKITPILKRSQDAVKTFSEPIELLFIDGAHEYEYVKQDFDLWFPKLLNGGVIALHDTDWEGPWKVVRQDIYSSSRFRNIRRVDSITYAEKISRASYIERVDNRLCLLWVIAVISAKKLKEFLLENSSQK